MSDATKPKPTAKNVALGCGAVFVLFVVLLIALGTCSGDPALEAESPASTSINATRPTEGQSSPAAFDMTGAQFIERLNAEWSEAGLLGAFAVRADSEIEAGEHKGGRTMNACASGNACVLVSQGRDGKVKDVLAIMAPDSATGSAAAGLQVLQAQIALISTFDPEAVPAFGKVVEAEVAKVAAGEETDYLALGSVCVRLAGGQGLGLWTAIKMPPCD